MAGSREAASEGAAAEASKTGAHQGHRRFIVHRAQGGDGPRDGRRTGSRKTSLDPMRELSIARVLANGVALEISINSVGALAKGQLHRAPGFAAAVDLLRRVSLLPPPPPRGVSARYCYSVWLRHLLAAHQNGLAPKLEVVAEIGPGHSIGTGLAALLSGAERYVAVDFVQYANVSGNLSVFEELLDLFARRAPIPDDEEFPNIYPKLENCRFPDWLPAVPSDAKVRKIRRALASSGSRESCIRYFAPYDRGEVVVPGGADLLISQAVMEHVDDAEALYRASHGWLKPGAIASHVIDYRSHGTSKRWNGHWTYSEAAWGSIRGGRPYLLNRLTHSEHRERLAASGFDILADAPERMESEVLRDQLAPRFRAMSEDDLRTCCALLQAVRR